MFSRSLLVLAACLLPASLFGQGADAYQVRYAANLNVPGNESYIDIVNTGYVNGATPAGNICVNVYVYATEPGPDNEEIQSCCSCLTTPNGLYNLGVNRDLLSNTLTGIHPGSVAIKLTGTLPVGGGCDPGAPGALTSGVRAWGTTQHLNRGAWVTTETPFNAAFPASGSEIAKLSSQCGFIETIGSGFGICASCRLGGLSKTAK